MCSVQPVSVVDQTLFMRRKKIHSVTFTRISHFDSYCIRNFIFSVLNQGAEAHTDANWGGYRTLVWVSYTCQCDLGLRKPFNFCPAASIWSPSSSVCFLFSTPSFFYHLSLPPAFSSFLPLFVFLLLHFLHCSLSALCLLSSFWNWNSAGHTSRIRKSNFEVSMK